MKPNFMQKCYDQFITPQTREFIRLNVSVANRIYDILDERGMSQKDFAKLMGKTEAEVSRWLSGTHNFTMETIARINVNLKEDVLSVPEKQQFWYIPITAHDSVILARGRKIHYNYNKSLLMEEYEYAYN